MKTNYHTHTPRCGHAKGSEEAYIRKAVEAGLHTLGFSDHTPYPFDGGWFSHVRMKPQQLGEYVETVLTQKHRYADRIRVRVGVEAEYYPQFFREQLSFLRDHGVEYMIHGQHWLRYEEGSTYSGRAGDEEHLKVYCAQLRDAMQTGVYTYLAHPDLIRFAGEDAVYERYMRTLCRDARGCGIPLEINLHGMQTGRHYPAERFWRLAGEEGCKAVIACDAHEPDGLLVPEAEEKAREMAKRCGVAIIEEPELVLL